MFFIQFIDELEFFSIQKAKQLIKENSLEEAEAMVEFTYRCISMKNVVISEAAKTLSMSFYTLMSQEQYDKLVDAIEIFFNKDFPNCKKIKTEILEHAFKYFEEGQKKLAVARAQRANTTSVSPQERQDTPKFKSDGNVIFHDFGRKKDCIDECSDTGC